MVGIVLLLSCEPSYDKPAIPEVGSKYVPPVSNELLAHEDGLGDVAALPEDELPAEEPEELEVETGVEEPELPEEPLEEPPVQEDPLVTEPEQPEDPPVVHTVSIDEVRTHLALPSVSGKIRERAKDIIAGLTSTTADEKITEARKKIRGYGTGTDRVKPTVTISFKQLGFTQDTSPDDIFEYRKHYRNRLVNMVIRRIRNQANAASE